MSMLSMFSQKNGKIGLGDKSVSLPLKPKLREENMKKVAMYVRDASFNQSDDNIEVQVREMEKHAKEREYDIVRKYVDKIGKGVPRNREIFEQILEDGKKGIFSVLLVHKDDGFAQNIFERVIYKRELKKQNISVESTLGTHYGGTDREMLEMSMEVMLEYYSRHIANGVSS